MESSNTKVLGAPIGRSIGAPASGDSDIDGDGDGFITRGGKDNVPAPVNKIVKASNILEPASTLAEARKMGKAWMPITRKGWSPEMHKKLEEMDDYEKRLAQVAEPFWTKFKNHERFHGVWTMLHAGGWGDNVKFDLFEARLKLNFTEEELNSKEIKNLFKFVKENDIPVSVRWKNSMDWASLYLNHAIKALDKEGIPENDPFRLWLKQDLYAISQGGSLSEVRRWTENRFGGMENYGRAIQHMVDLQDGEPPKDADKVAKKLVENPNRRISLNVTETAFEKILDDGRLLNLFENNGKNAFADPKDSRDPKGQKEKAKLQKENRLLSEMMIFGIPLVKQKKSAHPLYGFFHGDGIQSIGRLTEYYGEISLVMKKEVETRSTMTAGDSLAGKFFGSSPLNNPDGVGVQGGFGGTVNDKKPNFEGINALARHTYHEAQIFGGVKVSDIAYIAVPQGFEFKNPATKNRLVDLDISIVYTPKNGVLSEPPELKTKADDMEKATLIAVSDNRKLYETENDKGYLMVGSKKIDVPSVGAVLKFGNWIFAENTNTKVYDLNRLVFEANTSVRDYFYIASNSAKTKTASPYTNNALRERIKNRIMAGSDGGRPGQWSARKAQLLALRYRAAGGGYKKGKKPTKKQRSLRKWTREKWRTSDGKPALRDGKMRRYLPDKVWGKLTPSQRAATNRKKIEGDKRGRQFVPNTEVARKKGKAYRSRTR